MDSYKDEIKYIQHVIKKDCHGLVFSNRNVNDKHVKITIIVEDDENWFISKQPSFSSFWLPEMIALMTDGLAWLQASCETDPSGYGWQFKT